MTKDEQDYEIIIETLRTLAPKIVERFAANRQASQDAQAASEASHAWIRFASAAIASDTEGSENTEWAANVADNMLKEWAARFGVVMHQSPAKDKPAEEPSDPISEASSAVG